jgi:Ran GTPase-activating protein (RanGAP) involved in mRNA processing and transport
MNALEFTVRIEQGIIRLPKQYNEYENAQVRIIMLVETPQNQLSQREKLLITFNKMKQQRMFQSIENPTIWQKQLRDEWE